MKHIYIFLLTTLPLIGYSQEIYTSPLTQNFITEQLEETDRIITITASEIIFASTTATGREIKTFKILDKTREEMENLGLCTIYICSSMEGSFGNYVFVPVGEKVEFIDIYQPKQLDQEKVHMRLLID